MLNWIFWGKTMPVPGTSLLRNKLSFLSFLATLKTNLQAPVKLLPVTRNWKRLNVVMSRFGGRLRGNHLPPTPPEPLTPKSLVSCIQRDHRPLPIRNIANRHGLLLHGCTIRSISAEREGKDIIYCTHCTGISFHKRNNPFPTPLICNAVSSLHSLMSAWDLSMSNNVSVDDCVKISFPRSSNRLFDEFVPWNFNR